MTDTERKPETLTHNGITHNLWFAGECFPSTGCRCGKKGNEINASMDMHLDAAEYYLSTYHADCDCGAYIQQQVCRRRRADDMMRFEKKPDRKPIPGSFCNIWVPVDSETTGAGGAR